MVPWRCGVLLAPLAIPAWVLKIALPGIASCAFGSVGGIVNNTIAYRRNITEPFPTRKWPYGLAADIFIGAVAGLVTFLGGINDVPLPKILLAAVFAGVSGATYFTKTQEVNEARRQVKAGRARSQALKKASDLALEPSIRETKSDGAQE